MPAFGLIWSGQFLSFVGTGMTRFGLTIWAWQITGRATELALVGFFSFAPMISPLAGALVDRWNRKLTMMISDLAAGIATIAILILYLSGHLEIWHLYIASAFTGVFEAFQFPAYRASITTMIPKRHYARATAMIQLAGYASNILAPIGAGLLIAVIGIGGLMAIDIATFLFGIGTLLLVRIPQPVASPDGAASRGNLWQESLFGFRYIFSRPSLIGLQTILMFININTTFGLVLLAPMILARSGSDSIVLGTVQSAFGIGGIVGGILFTIWGGPKKLIHGALLGCTALLIGEIALGMARGLVTWTVAAFMMMLFSPMLNGCISAIWQKKIPADIQGKVFAVRRMLAEIGRPVSMLIAGPLADRIMEPAMAADGAFARIFSPIVGSGPGAGMALILVFGGLIGAAVSVAGYLFRAVRDVEEILPDQDVSIE
ncbi:MFS transporter [Candidatus Bipolaricaulota bacterium]|nr:MFS transporter [Candidatus Bipolaricaulota bacterium]